MDIQLIGTIVRVLPMQSGTKRDGGEWQKQEYLLSVEGERYEKKVCFQIFGSEKIALMKLQENERVCVHLEIRANEYNGKFYNSIDCWRVDRNNEPQQQLNTVVNADKQSAPNQQPSQSSQQQLTPQENNQNASQQTTQQPQENDLPF